MFAHDYNTYYDTYYQYQPLYHNFVSAIIINFSINLSKAIVTNINNVRFPSRKRRVKNVKFIFMDSKTNLINV